MEARELKLAEIHPSPDNIRHRVGRLKELQASMEAVGLLQPIVVVENDNGYAIVAGHRRFAAAQALGWETIPVVIREFADAEKIEAMIVENFHRDDLTPIEQAEGLFRLGELGLQIPEIVEKTGLSKKLVRERIKLLDLPKVGQEAIHQGRLSIDAGLELAKEATDQELVSEVIEALLGEDARGDVAWNLRNVRERRAKAEAQVKLLEKVEKLKELGREVVTAEESEDGGYYGRYKPAPRSWKEVVKPTERYWGDGIQLDPKAHAKEDCAVWYFTPADRHYEAKLTHLCRKPSRHTFTGDSELKVPKAEDTHSEKEKARLERKREREERAAINARYSAALSGKKPPKPLMFQVAALGFLNDVWDEHRKTAAQLLGLEPIERKHGSGKDFNTPLYEHAEKNPEQVMLALYLAKRDPLDKKSRYQISDPWAGLHEDLAALIPEEVTG